MTGDSTIVELDELAVRGRDPDGDGAPAAPQLLGGAGEHASSAAASRV